MSRSFITLAALSMAVATPFISLQAQAVQRTHVSAAFGADSNAASNCTAAAPCRFFTAAMTVTDPNGEVIVLDSGGYGGVTITQSVALIAPTGVYAGISVFPGADGVTIATAGVNVVLRGLSINGQGGNNGISMTAGNSLTVENCVISNHGQNGIYVNAAAIVNITDTTARRNAFNGILLSSGSRAVITRAVVSNNINHGIYVVGVAPNTFTYADITDTTADGNSNGFYASSSNATASVSASIRDSRAARNQIGIYASSDAGAKVLLTASNNIISNNSLYGVAAEYVGTKVWISGNTISANAGGLVVASSALFETAGNNAMRNNTVDVTGSITAIALK